MRPLSQIALVCAIASATAVLPAQILKPGSFVCTTFKPALVSAKESSVQILDPFAKTATRLTIKNFPASATEGPDSVFVENVVSMLLGTRLTASGNIYRARLAGTNWTATQLNTSATGIASVAAIVVIGSTIYMAGSAAVGTGGTSSLIMQMPSKGGKVTLYMDVGKAGSSGLGNAMCGVGKELHFFTFDSSASTTTASEHWKVDTSATTPKAVKVGKALPKSLAGQGTANYAAVQAYYSSRIKSLIIAGVTGDILWRTVAGKDTRQAFMTGGAIDSMAINTNTGAIGVGDRAGNYDELRVQGTWELKNQISLIKTGGVDATTRLSNMAYVPAAANYWFSGPGCAQKVGTIPRNFINSLPTKTNKALMFTCDATTKTALLIIGIKRVIPGFDLGPGGAPGCFLHQTIDVQAFANKVTATQAQVGPFAVPPGLPDATVYTQWLVLDNKNAAGFVASDSRRLDLR